MASILRHRRRRDFTVLPNIALRDARLSFRATGLLAYLLMLPDGSSVDSTALSKRKREGRDAIRSAFNELVAAGYATRRKEQVEHGHWRTVLEVTDDPSPTTDSQASDRSLTNGPSEDQALKNQEPVTNPPEPPKGRTRTRGVAIPDDFTVPVDALAWAAENFPGFDAIAETGMFRDYWQGNGKTKADWVATWRVWIRRAAREHPGVAPSARAAAEADCDECENQRWVDGPDGRLVRCPKCRSGIK